MIRLRRIAAFSAAVLIIPLIVPTTGAWADPISDGQWYLRYLNVTSAQRYSQGQGITVAVIDTGVDATHPDLKGSVLAGTDLTPRGQGTKGWLDVDGHGTDMAGLIAGHGKVRGIAPGAKILPVRHVTFSGTGGAIPKAIDWAVDHGATVLCIAFSSTENSDLRLAVERAIAADVVVVAGVGNTTNGNRVTVPAALPGVLAVAGVDKNGNHAEISVRGDEVLLSAPATDIVSTGLNHGYRKGTGTSDSTAIVAGAAALVRAKYPKLSAVEVIHRLTATADDKGPQGRDNEYGYGVVNLVKALTADVPALTPTAAPTTQAGPTPGPDKEDSDGIPPVVIILAGVALLLLAGAGVFWAATRRPTN